MSAITSTTKRSSGIIPVKREETSSQPTHQERLEALAVQFKQEVYKNFEGFDLGLEELSEEDSKVIEELWTYPELAKEVQQDPKTREDFFKWCIRDKLPLRVMVLYPSLCEEISEISLNRRLNLVFKKMLRVTQEGDVTIPIATSLKETKPKRYNLLTPYKQIDFGNGISYSIKQIFDEFAKLKEGKVSQFVVLNGAIRPFASDYSTLGGRINTTDMNWFHLLEPYQRLTLEEVKTIVVAGIKDEKEKEEFLKSFNNKKSVVRAVSTTKTTELSVKGDNHALVEIFLPDGKGGYGMYPFGDFPKKFPKNILEAIPFLYSGAKRIVRYPDQGNLLPGYIQHYYTVLSTEKAAINVLQKVGQRIASEGQFDLRVESCSDGALENLSALEHPLPDFFNVPKEEVEIQNVGQRFLLDLFENSVWLPRIGRDYFATEIHLPVGLNLRHLSDDEEFSSFMDLTKTEEVPV